MKKYKKHFKTLLFLFFFIGCLRTNAQDKFTIKCILMKDGIALDSTKTPFRIDVHIQRFRHAGISKIEILKSIQPFANQLGINI